MQEWSLKIMTQQQIVLKLTKSMQKMEVAMCGQYWKAHWALVAQEFANATEMLGGLPLPPSPQQI